MLRRCELTDAGARAQQVTSLLRPALAGLDQVRQSLGEQQWDGLVHRRCRLRPGAPGQPSDDRQPAPEQACTTVEVLGRRAGWELLRASTCWRSPGAGTPRVVHDLARYLWQQPGAVPKALPQVEALAGAVPGAGGPRLQLSPADVRAWAQASGDRNAIHVEPGRANALGLPVGAGSVVVHGMLLAALSLAVAPLRAPEADLRFLRPLPLALDGTVWLAADRDGGLWHAGRLLLRRGDHRVRS